MSEDFEKNLNQEPEQETPSVPEAPEESPAPEVSASSEPVNETAAEPQSQQADAEVPTVQAEPVNPQVSKPFMENTEQPYSPYSSRPYTSPNRVQQGPVFNIPPQANPQFRQPYQQRPPMQPPIQQPPQPPVKTKTSSGGKIVISIVAVLLVVAIVLASIIVIKPDLFGDTKAPANPETPTTVEGAENANSYDIASTPKSEDALTTAQIAEKVKPSIVGIVVYSGSSVENSAGEGTGVIMSVDDTGTYTYIVTCAHVISDPGIRVTVQTEDGTSYPAEIVGYDTRTDLGVVRIEATGFTTAEFGKSDNLRVGDSVFAIGNPGGVEFFGSFTGGYVSAIDRPVNSEIGYTMKCIQHDAAINPGNSGGALVNVYGQVIGINSQKIAATEFEGMGFAIPTSSAQTIVEALINYGYVPNRPKLGITYYPVNASAQYSMIARINNLPAGTLIIDEIAADGALANTEARRYDMIIAVNGNDLTTADVLLELIDNGTVGDKLTLTLCRVNSNYSIETFDITVTLVEDRSGSAQENATEPEYAIDPFG